MTTPAAPQGSGFLGNLLGGVAGTLAGTNPLQQSVDQLTNAVNRLTNSLGNSNMGAGGAGGFQGQQQVAGNARGFPAVNVPGVNRQAGIGGGGAGGAGNVAPPAPFGGGNAGINAPGGLGRAGGALAGGVMLGSAFAGYGQQQMPFQLGLNAYATMSMLGMGGMNRGMGNYQSSFNTLTNNFATPIASSPMDALTLRQQLAFLAMSPNVGSTAMGRTGFGAAAAFGLTNPSLSGAQAGSLAQQIYSPGFSQKMMMMGYGITPRSMSGGMPQSMGAISQALIKGWYGRSKVNPAQLYRSLSGGNAYYNLQALGLNPTQAAPLVEGFNQLFNAGLSPARASQLFSQAASSSASVSRPAQERLSQLGVRTVTSDIQKLRNNQSSLTQRNIDISSGFNSALTASTDSLDKFNRALNAILSNTPLGGMVGYGGGLMGVLSGTNHGNALSGLGGLGLLGLAGRGLFGGGATTGLAAAAGGASGLAGIAAMLGIPIGAGILAKHSISSPGSSLHTGNILKNILSGTGDFFSGTLFKRMFQNTGGGAGGSPVATSSQQSTPGGRQAITSGGSATSAIQAAESQLGVPYVWGGEAPGVGFDCSGLVQWAYKQAGVGIPRTSEQQWAALRKKSVPTNKVQPGDLVFAAGSDGTPNSPGHVGMMVTNNSLIEAPQTGENVKIIGYNPKSWSHAARPTGHGGMGTLPGNNTGNSSLTGLYGNTGSGTTLGNYGSVNEVDIISSMGGFSGGAPGLPFGSGKTNMPGKNGSSSGSLSAKGKSASAAQAIAKQLSSGYGWSSGVNWNDLILLWNRESGWKWNAKNSSSGAYGIPQSLPGDKMASAGGDWMTNPATQIKWGLSYIKGRYGSPANAWQHEQSIGWYGTGTQNSRSGISVVGERGPEIMMDGGGNRILSNAQSMALLKAVSSQPAQTPWQTLSDLGQGGKVTTPGISSTPHVVVNFGTNSIHVHVPSGSDASSSGREIARQTIKHIDDEDLWQTIGRGDKN